MNALLGNALLTRGGIAVAVRVKVLSVSKLSPQILYWSFDHDMLVATPGGEEGALEVFVGTWISPTGIFRVTAGVIQTGWAVPIPSGAPWRIIQAPTNLYNTELDLLIPQSGNVS